MVFLGVQVNLELFGWFLFLQCTLQLYCEIKNKEVAKTFRKAISKKEGIAALAGTSHTSAEGTTHSVAEAEKVAFASESGRILLS